GASAGSIFATCALAAPHNVRGKTKNNAQKSAAAKLAILIVIAHSRTDFSGRRPGSEMVTRPTQPYLRRRKQSGVFF
ncbi:MAG: hypothetical protein ACI83P_001304, partial [Janthinobacterium sp.]